MPNQFETQANDLAASYWKARAIQELRRGEDTSTLEVFLQSNSMANSVGVGWATTPRDQRDDELKWYCCRQGNSTFIFIDGINSATAGALTAQGYFLQTPAPGGDTPLVRNWWFQAKAYEIYFLVPDIFFTTANCYFVGHSAGGGVCVELASLMALRLAQRPNVRMMLMGTPKIARGRNWPGGAIDEICHYIMPGDPVPEIPPLLGGWPGVIANLSLPQIRRGTSFCYNPGGVNMMPDATTVVANRPLNVTISPTTAVGTWIYQLVNEQANEHNINYYVTRLGLWRNIPSIAPVDQSFQDSLRMQPPPPQVREMRATLDAAYANAAADAERVANVIVRVPYTRRFYVTRVGKVYWVGFEGQLIISAPFRRRAHGIARAGNEFLRRIQNGGYVDTATITELLTSYFAQASDPTGNFVPVMNTTP